jgi:hypothetical protein
LYDLNRSSKATNIELVDVRKLKELKVIKNIKVIINKGQIFKNIINKIKAKIFVKKLKKLIEEEKENYIKE